MERYHAITISESTVTRILRRHGLPRLPQRSGRRTVHTRRYNKQVPGHHIQIDVKFLTFNANNGAKLKRYQYTAIDDATRIRALKIYDRHTQKNAIHFVNHVKAIMNARNVLTDRIYHKSIFKTEKAGVFFRIGLLFTSANSCKINRSLTWLNLQQ